MRAALLSFLFAAACAAPPPAAGHASAPPAASAAAPVVSALACDGHAEQGGFLVCRTPPGARIFVDGAEMTRADDGGYAVVGFDRDAKAQARIEARAENGDLIGAYDPAIAPQSYVVQRVDGLPQDTVTPRDPALLARIARERKAKDVGFASRAALRGFAEAWIWPLDGRISGPWGNQRVLNRVPASPHMGLDIAAPVGTPIRAPAGGVVTLAEPDMHYEGGLVFIDHGQGLISMYLHMSRVDVKAGDRVTQGQVLGAVGAKGRATGPHLCWRLKWRDRALDPGLVPVAPMAQAAARVP
ncbi:MAG: M23 family metallopeptidase [Hyphomonadaceae bacterium]